MKRIITIASILAILLVYNTATAKDGDSGSGNGGNSGSESSNSSSGLETEVEHGVVTTKADGNDDKLTERLRGRIVLQVEDKGQAWYIDPEKKTRLSLGRPEDAFRLMREKGLGISEDNFNRLENHKKDSTGHKLALKLAGKILLEVEDKGKAWYLEPATLKLHYLGRPADALKVMRDVGLGIRNDDLAKIAQGMDNKKAAIEIMLAAEGNSGLAGKAELYDLGIATKVEIKLNETTAGLARPAHIHEGNVPNLGAVKYSLDPVVNGKSETTLNIKITDLLAQRPLGINVHKSAAEIAVSVSSGNL